MTERKEKLLSNCCKKKTTHLLEQDEYGEPINGTFYAVPLDDVDDKGRYIEKNKKHRRRRD